MEKYQKSEVTCKTFSATFLLQLKNLSCFIKWFGWCQGRAVQTAVVAPIEVASPNWNITYK